MLKFTSPSSQYRLSDRAIWHFLKVHQYSVHQGLTYHLGYAMHYSLGLQQVNAVPKKSSTLMGGIYVRVFPVFQKSTSLHFYKRSTLVPVCDSQTKSRKDFHLYQKWEKV